ncbi:Gfo/Idh/MocA family oxidoreductase [Brevibacillus sp. AY1]|uniref:Gfo/Idh/MocA family protein n=1 Tax=Brevibacillus sp. AY1 TaxID=2807621 RepID=UPI002456875B|nr:Gfo/Idh/MocA family oxidoreductase [Brevibacillus sp. AY1]MDH4618270.1 Gfo/Idh/MocA family oxidoreductase [Brevibacillus sp. AY1]
MTTIGIIGLGPMGQRYVEALQTFPQYKLAVTDVRTAAIEKVRDTYSVKELASYTTHVDMLKNENIDLLIIASNGPSHYSLFIDALRYGIPRIICEKPIATSLEEARKMIDLASAKDVLLSVNHGRRWADDYVLLREKIKNEVIGSVESIMFSMGGGQMGCNGTHFIDLVSFLLDDKIEQLCGFLNDEGVPNPRGAQFKDPGGYAILHFRSGTRMFFELTEDTGIPPLLVINGRYGRITVNELQRVYIIEARTVADRSLPVTRYGTPLLEKEIYTIKLDMIELCRELITSMLRDQVPADPQHAADALEAIIGIHYSSERENRLVKLPITDREYVEKRFLFT